MTSLTPEEAFELARLAACDQLQVCLAVASDAVIALHAHARGLPSDQAPVCRRDADRLAAERAVAVDVLRDALASPQEIRRTLAILEELVERACVTAGITVPR